MGIQENLIRLKQLIPAHIRVVATSKTHPIEDILACYETGHRIFGENKVQELLQKYEALPKDIEWHFIGHLQTNKIKQIVPFITLIHGVDSIRVIQEIDKQALKVGRIVPCLLQVHIAKEETKFGFSPEELLHLINSGILTEYKNTQIVGLMSMASNTDDEIQIEGEFRAVADLFESTKAIIKSDNFQILSIGMSGDYPIAIKSGGNLIRIGSLIFGERDYVK